MVDDLRPVFAVEYSLSQNATHILSLRAMVANNRKNVLRAMRSDYVPIGLFNSREDAERFDLEFRPTLDEQAQREFKNRNWSHISQILTELLAKYSNLDTDEE